MHGTSETSTLGSFLGMWIVMMAVMMLPSAILMLWRYRQAVANAGAMRLALVGTGYFFVWVLIGALVFPVGVALKPVATPIASVVVVLLAGAYQLTDWKAHHLGCCRRAMSVGVGGAWQHGVRLGLHCARCCANLMVALLVAGVMDVRVMLVAGLAILVERLDVRFARAAGVAVVMSALFQLLAKHQHSAAGLKRDHVSGNSAGHRKILRSAGESDAVTSDRPHADIALGARSDVAAIVDSMVERERVGTVRTQVECARHDAHLIRAKVESEEWQALRIDGRELVRSRDSHRRRGRRRAHDVITAARGKREGSGEQHDPSHMQLRMIRRFDGHDLVRT